MRDRDGLPSDTIGYEFLELGRRDRVSPSGDSAVITAGQRNAAVFIPYVKKLTATLCERQSRLPTLIAGCHWRDVEFHCCLADALSSRKLGQHECWRAPQLAAVFAHTVPPLVRHVTAASHRRSAQ